MDHIDWLFAKIPRRPRTANRRRPARRFLPFEDEMNRDYLAYLLQELRSKQTKRRNQ